jgi:hypothetical protein
MVIPLSLEKKSPLELLGDAAAAMVKQEFE